jgi:hypothetical protein
VFGFFTLAIRINHMGGQAIGGGGWHFKELSLAKIAIGKLVISSFITS